MKVKKQGILFSYFLAEILLINLSFFTISFYKYSVILRTDYLFLLTIFNVSWISIVFLNGPQNLYTKFKFTTRLKNHILNTFLLLGIVSPLILLFNNDEYSRTMIFGTTLMFSLLSFVYFIIMSSLSGFFNYTKRGSKLLILGAEEKGKEILNFTKKNRHLGYEVIGFLDDTQTITNDIANGNGKSVNVLGKIKDLEQIIAKTPIDEIVITMPTYRQQEIKYAIETADFNGIRVNVVPDFVNDFGKANKAYNYDNLSVIETRQVPLDLFHYYSIKRIFDILFALSVLILLLPVLLTIAILIKLDSKGPVFYKPVRKGMGGKEFTCFKFRSMYTNMSDDPRNGSRSTQKDDPRITRVGKWMRKKDIDELPQFINVLLGDMSVVGPRPHRVNLNTSLQHDVEKYMFRHYVKPGITGWAQVNGWRGPTTTHEQKQERVKHDLAYIENWSFWLDIRIIYLTVFGRKTRINAF